MSMELPGKVVPIGNMIDGHALYIRALDKGRISSAASDYRHLQYPSCCKGLVSVPGPSQTRGICGALTQLSEAKLAGA